MTYPIDFSGCAHSDCTMRHTCARFDAGRRAATAEDYWLVHVPENNRNHTCPMYVPMGGDEEAGRAGKREIRAIRGRDCYGLILNTHYAGRIPSISYAFGLYVGGELEGVVTYGAPASPWVSVSLTGRRNAVLELNRLVLRNNRANDASWLVAKSLSMLPNGTVVVSYADSAQGHVGYVYQACNFLYGGASRPRTDMSAGDGKHPRHHLGDRANRVERSAKHRYWTVTGSGGRKVAMGLKWAHQQYPKKERSGT